MKFRLITWAALSATLGSLSLNVLADISVKDPWVRATVAEQKATGAFMQLTATKSSRLISATSPVAGVVEIHEMTMEDNVMKMRAVPNGLDLPAGKTVELKPGSYHVMLMDLHQHIQVGESVPLTLVVENPDKKRETIEVKAPVRSLAGGHGPKASMDGASGMHHHHH